MDIRTDDKREDLWLPPTLWRNWGWNLAIWLVAVGWLPTLAWGQFPGGASQPFFAIDEDAPTVPGGDAGEPLADAAEVAEEAAAEPPTTEQLLQRLERTEQELKELRESRSEDDDLLDKVKERFKAAKDPAITTVDEQTRKSPEKKAEAKSKKWFDRLSIRGYAQFRYNTSIWEEDGSAPVQHTGDRSFSDDQNFLIRRARVIISGDLSDHLYVYLQPDFASGVPGSPDAIQFAQIRDWYGDIYVDTDKVHRFRVGQSKIPYGWENLQSSSNRIALDRADGLNSAARNERDLGIFYYWTPEEAQDLFKAVLDQGLKGSGNYGVFALGAYNGQGGSLAEQNDDLHLITRLAWPFYLNDEQIVEVGIQAYTGKYTVLSSPIRAQGIGPLIRPLGTLETDGRDGIRDERVAGTFVYYPQPFGIQAEWNVGNGPALNDAQTAVIERSLQGGYGQLFYKLDTPTMGTLFPFLRFGFYRGGYKAERNAPYSDIKEWDFGTEWQFTPQFELTTQYTISNRTNTTPFTTGRSYLPYEGHSLRMQLQINY